MKAMTHLERMMGLWFGQSWRTFIAGLVKAFLGFLIMWHVEGHPYPTDIWGWVILVYAFMEASDGMNTKDKQVTNAEHVTKSKQVESSLVK